MDKNKPITTTTIRVPTDTWSFIRKTAFDQHRSINEIIVNCLESYKTNREKLLQSTDTMIS